MLVHVIGSIVLVVMAFAGDGGQWLADWTRYLLLLNIGAVGAMFLGVASSLPELVRSRTSTTSVALAAVAFAIATGALAWHYHLLVKFYELATARFTLDVVELRAAQLEDLAEQLQSGLTLAIRDIAYGAGLYFVTTTVKASAALNDQLALRDRAASMSRAVLVLVVGDLFYQLVLAEGVNVGLAITGVLASLAMLAYWVWLHGRLQRFLFDSSWFVNQPHNLPGATVVKLPGEPPAPRVSRPSMPKVAPHVAPQVATEEPAPRPSQPAPLIVVAQPTAPTPRAASASEGDTPGDGPRFLR